MNRREFIATSLTVSLAANSFGETKFDFNTKEYLVIEAISNILFPKNQNTPSAKEFNATSYLFKVSTHNSFDKRDIETLQNGVTQILKIEKEFLNITDNKQEEIIKKYSKTKEGEKFLSLLLYYILEALLSDPIYGGDKNEIGWKWLNHNAGIPRPKRRFG